MNALAIHLYLIIRYINLSFNYFCNFYRIIELYKNTNIPSYCVIGSDTIIRGPIDCSPYSLIVTESTATVRKEGVFRDKNDDMINYLQ